MHNGAPWIIRDPSQPSTGVMFVEKTTLECGRTADTLLEVGRFQRTMNQDMSETTRVSDLKSTRQGLTSASASFEKSMPRTVCAVAVVVCAGQAFAAPLPAAKLNPFFENHCVECHDGTTKKGGLDLESLSRDPADAETLRRWVRVFDRVESGEMPPKKKARPETEALTAFLTTLKGPLAAADRAQREVVHRRLNRAEYENTVRDLFLVRAEVAAMLPEDGKAHGFDNIGEALSSSTELVESYLRAADVVIDMVLAQEKEPAKFTKHSTFTEGWRNRNNAKQVFRFLDEGVVAYNSFQKSTHIRNFAAPVTGTYRVRFHARAYHSTQPVKMEIGGGDVHQSKRGRHTIGYFEARPEVTEIVFEDWFRAGDGFSVVPFGIGRVRVGKEPRYPGPGLLLLDYDVEGPLDTDLLAGRRELLRKVNLKTGTLADAQDIMARLLPRGFRRPATEAQIAGYVGLMKRMIEEGCSFEAALRVGLRAVLCSPDFLFLSEPAEDASGQIGNFALASRLSYFLWSSMPDAELLELARRGELGRPATLRAQVERLLASPKAAAFTKNFTGQWLKLRDIKVTEPDTALYPEYDDLLEYSMIEETVRFFDEVLREDLSVMEFVDSDWSMLNDRLAAHYGISGVEGVQFRRVPLPKDSVRGGVMTQASVLKVTANGTTTSPVTRGAWAIENLLGIHVPPPPPVSAVDPDLTGATTLRQQLDKHRNDTSCASCHSKIDPPGFALESFDPIGGWREHYRIPTAVAKIADPSDEQDGPPAYKSGLPVDATGTLPTGETFNGIREFKALLKRDSERVARGVTEKLLTYGLGRGLGFSDRATVQHIVERTREKNYGLRSLVQEVVASEAFCRR